MKQIASLLSIVVYVLMISGCQNNTTVPLTETSHTWEIVKTTGSDASECGEYTLALDTDGYLWGWGDRRNELMGFFVSRPHTGVARRITHHHDWQKVVMGCYSAFGLRSDGSLWGWGANSGIASGQIIAGADAGKLIKPREIKDEQKAVIMRKMKAVTGRLVAKEIDI